MRPCAKTTVPLGLMRLELLLLIPLAMSSRAALCQSQEANSPSDFVCPIADPEESARLATIYRDALTSKMSGDYDKSLSLMLEAWSMNNPAFDGTRSTFLARAMQSLAKTYPPAMNRFVELRDGLSVELPPKAPERQTLFDWVVLNRVIDDESTTANWLRAADDCESCVRVLQTMIDIVEPAYVASGNWRGLARLFPKPRAKVQDLCNSYSLAVQDALGEMPTPVEQEIAEQALKDRAVNKIAIMYASMLAADRDNDAQSIVALAETCFGDSDVRIECLRLALNANEPRAIHRQWIADALANGWAVDELAARLEAAMQVLPNM